MPTTMTDDTDALTAWVGRRQSLEDRIAAGPVERLAATLDRDDPAPLPGDPLPPAWHWLYFLPSSPQSTLGHDGHDARGGFLPPTELPRRMWAGGRFAFKQPLRIGEAARRDSEIASVTPKQGRHGPLVFVTVRHTVSGENGPAIEEEHDIVYRDAPKPDAPTPAPIEATREAVWRRAVDPDPVLLFRFSALTFNAHRIHYDRPYVTGEEGYPGLLVHGPLLAILLLDLLRREAPDRALASFDYRAMAPVFDTAPFTVAGAPNDDGASVWIAGADGGVAMTGEARFVDRS